MPALKDLIVSLLIRATQSVMNQLAQDAAPLLGQNRILVIAPHPDDETLGCGGLILQARELGRQVRIVIVSDGAQGSTASAQPTPNLVKTRQQEALCATSRLGIDANAVIFLNLPDGALSSCASELDLKLSEQISAFLPDLILSPYEKENHPDHRAIAESVNRLRKTHANTMECRWVEYPVWFWPRGAWRFLLNPNRSQLTKLGITHVKDKKKQALEAYQSQLPIQGQGGSATGYFKPLTFAANFLGQCEYYISRKIT